MTARRRASVALALLLSLAPTVGSTAEPSGELRIGLAQLPDTLDPASVSGGPAQIVTRQLFQGLVEGGERGDIEPGLATQWGVSRDGLTWTFRLRPDVQFHNGAPLTPEAVAASLGRHLRDAPGGEPLSPWARVFRGPTAAVREVRPGEPGTVQVQLAQPFSPLLAVLAHPALAVVLTQPDSPVPFLGTGPYRVVERTTGRLVLEAASPGRGDRPRSARLVFQEMADDPAALAELGPRGSLDVHFPQSPPAWAGLGLQTLSAPSWRLGLLALRTPEGILARKAVRQAIALALDPALVRPALGRWARPWASYLPAGAWALRELPPTGHDPARARRILATARVAPPTLTLLAGDLPGAPDPGPLTEAIRLSLGVGGFRLQVRQPAADTYRDALRGGEGDLALLESALEIDDPHFGLRPLVASDAAVRGSATNVAFYRNAVVDDLLLRGSQFAFRPERQRLYHRLQTLVADDVPYIPLYVRLQWAVARPGVRGLTLNAAGRHRLDRVWLEGPAESPAVPPPPVPGPAPSLPAPVAPDPPR